MFKKINFFSKNFFKKKRNIIALGIIVVLAVFSLYYALSQYNKEVFPPNQKLKNQISIQTPKLISVQNKMKESLPQVKTPITTTIQNKMKESLPQVKTPITTTIQNKFNQLFNLKTPKLVNLQEGLFSFWSFEIIKVEIVKDVFNEYISLYSPVFPYAVLIGSFAFLFLFLRKLIEDLPLLLIVSVNLAFIFTVFLGFIDILWYLPVLALTILYIVFQKIIV